MKHAYLVMAHNEPEILKVLISMLDDPRNDIYLHIDKKSDLISTEELAVNNAQLFILEKRINLYWMNISQIRTELLLFETAYKKGPYAYYHVVSGVDLPIKTQDYIHRFCDERQGFEFVAFENEPHNVADMKRKISKYHILQNHYRDNNYIRFRICNFLRKTLLYLQDKIGYSRKEEMEFKKGSNWVCVTHDFVEYLLQKKDFILKRFRYVPACDEIFLQTIIWNSPFKDKIYKVDDNCKGYLHHINWSRGVFPWVWKISDLDELKNSDKLFARKFSSDDLNIVSLIQKNIHKFSFKNDN